MSDFSEFSGIDSHCPELLLRCVKTLEMDDKAKFEEEEDRFCLHPDGLERQMSAWGMLHKPFAAGGRAHGWGGRGCERTAKEKRGLVEGKREDVMVFKNTGRLAP